MRITIEADNLDAAKAIADSAQKIAQAHGYRVAAIESRKEGKTRNVCLRMEEDE